MTRRFRWQRPFADNSVTVTRVAGDHELADEERQRRYTLDVHGEAADCDVSVTAPADCRYAAEDGHWVTVYEGAGLARVRLAADGSSTAIHPDGSSTAIHLLGPAFDDRLGDAIGGDHEAARELLSECGGPVAAALACGVFVDVEGFVTLVDALAAATGGASDALHAARYDLVRIAATTAAGPPVETAEDFEALATGLDGVDAIGDVDVLDALGDVAAVAHDSAGETRDFLAALGYDISELADRNDGRFFAYYLAQVARTAGVHDAKQQAARRAGATGHPDFETAKAAAERADYWGRGEAWRTAVLPAADQSVPAFAYVLANALYWTGDVGRTHSRADELCYEGAEAAAATIDLDWVVGHATYERHRAAAHRHRSARNHGLAVRNFEAARETAGAYSFLDPWEPTYSSAVVRSNRLSAARDHEAAVAVLDDALDELRDMAVPDDRFAEMRDHLVGQRHERRAKLAGSEDDSLAHLEAALDHYESLGFDRSIDRVAGKLERDAGESDHSRDSGGRGASLGPKPLLRVGRDAGPSLADIPDLHDFLTEPDPTAVGSADPGVLPDEHDDEFGEPGGRERDSFSDYR
jgi:hypothetical protein